MLVEEGFQVTIQLIHKNWRKELTAALRADASELRIICPFIQVGALDSLLSLKPGNVQVITRFKISDFVNGVSDVAALQKLLEADAQVRGIKNLHTKLYLFANRAIVTSANLTKAALDSNHEFGLVTDDTDTIDVCRNYFDDLWQRGGGNLSRDQVDEWEKKITRYRVSGGRSGSQAGLEDFGVDAGIADSPLVRMPTVVTDASQAFVKFLGLRRESVPLSTSTSKVIELDGCHWAVSYSYRCRAVQDGNIIFMAWATRDLEDYRIFGWAVGMQHQPGRDDVQPDDIDPGPKSEGWPHYIRVHNAEFVAGPLANGVSRNDMKKELGENSLKQRNRSGIALSEDEFFWLREKLQEAFDTHGKVPHATLAQLYRPTVPDR